MDFNCHDYPSQYYLSLVNNSMSMREFIDLTEAFDFKVQGHIAHGMADAGGDGLWSSTPMKNIKVKLLPDDVFWYDETNEQGRPDLVGQINAHFNPNQWDVNSHGLLYTDDLFEKGIRAILRAAGFKFWTDIEWSEQGMQGDDYASFDVGNKLALELDEKGFIEVTKYEDIK